MTSVVPSFQAGQAGQSVNSGLSPLIEAHGLRLLGAAQNLLAGPLDVDLKSGDCLFVSGANGSGKTTLLRTLAGAHSAYEGHLIRRVDQSKIAYLPQLSNVRFHLPLTLFDVLSMARTDLLHEEILNRTNKIGLIEPETLNRDWNSASGGERQRLLLTRIFLSDPAVLLLDEPANHLDATSRRQLLELIERFVAEPNKQRAAVIVTHETDLKAKFPHRLLDLGGGPT